jgi:hypothetical protein
MSLDTAALRSRRSVITAALGAGAATLATAAVAPVPVRAGSDGDVVLGATNTSGNTTLVRNTTTSNAALMGLGTTGDGVVGESAGDSKSGVYGYTTVTGGYGVFGRNKAQGYGVGAEGQTAVWASGTNYGVYAQAVNGSGVLAESTNGPGVQGTTYASGQPSVTGRAIVGGNLVAVGSLGNGIGVGAYGYSPDGTGVWAESKTGVALDVIGKARFSRSGRATIGAGKRYVDVSLASKGGLGGTPLLFATLRTYRSGVYVAGVRPNYPSTGKFRIYLNKALSAATYVSWMVLN